MTSYPLDDQVALQTDPELLVLRVGNIEDTHGYLAAKLRRARNELGESQAVFAKRAGVPLRTYKRFELTGQGSIETLIRALRAIERADRLRLLFPSPLPTRKPTLEERLSRAQDAWAAARSKRKS
jgi:transcriptional regulator with XRE-family HTH domain